MKHNTMAIVQIIIISITCVIFIGRLFFGLFKRFSPIKRDYQSQRNEGQQQATNFKRQNSILDKTAQILKSKFFPVISHESTIADDELISVCKFYEINFIQLFELTRNFWRIYHKKSPLLPSLFNFLIIFSIEYYAINYFQIKIFTINSPRISIKILYKIRQ